MEMIHMRTMDEEARIKQSMKDIWGPGAK